MSETKMPDTLKYYVILMRYKRSGSALLTQLLDAHPNCVFVRREELYASLDKWKEGPHKIYQHLHYWAARRKGRPFSANGYKYPIDGVGRVENPIAIGHKSSTRRYMPVANSQEKLDEFQKAVGLPLKFLHLVRDPYDQVNARWQQKEFRRSNAPLDELVTHVREQTTANYNMWKRAGQEYHQIHYEDLQKNPAATMATVCRFLTLPILNKHLENCEKLIYKDSEVEAATWTQQNRSDIAQLIKDYPEFYRKYDGSNN